MLKIIISGCNGHMGRVVEALCQADPAVEVCAGFDVMGSADRDFSVYTSPAQFTGEADAVIDFSSPAALAITSLFSSKISATPEPMVPYPIIAAFIIILYSLANIFK